MSLVRKVTAKTFKTEVLHAETPVLVDLYAKWCGPCRTMAPALERLAREFDGRLKIVRIDTDAELKLARSFRVSSVPTLVMMRHGKAVDTAVGIVSRQRICQMLEKATANQRPRHPKQSSRAADSNNQRI